MTELSKIREMLTSGECDKRIRDIYVDDSITAYNRDRYVKAVDKFCRLFPEYKAAEIYSAPGRSEVCGNHTDHQNGVVLATSINLDAIAVVALSSDGKVRLVSDDMPPEIVDTAVLASDKSEYGTTTALIRGVLAGLKDKGYNVGGFSAYITSDVLMGAGMSSSAAFESLIGTIISGLYNNMSIPAADIAKAGQYAENIYFGKPCGLMDQMACSVGGMIYIDFEDKDNVTVKKVESDFTGAGISLCIVDTKGSHADLTPDYAAIPDEMNCVAHAMGMEHLRAVNENDFFAAIPRLKEVVSGRAILRAIHFFEEEKRVLAAVNALKSSDYEAFMCEIKKSGISSAQYLQNIYSPRDTASQNVTVALAVTEHCIGDMGVCRVHGGGFAGTIQAFIKNEAVPAYRQCIEAVYGAGSCHVLKVRKYGGINVIGRYA